MLRVSVVFFEVRNTDLKGLPPELLNNLTISAQTFHCSYPISFSATVMNACHSLMGSQVLKRASQIDQTEEFSAMAEYNQQQH